MISLEMKALELAAKTFSREFELDYSALLHGNSDASEALTKCDTSKIRGWPVWIDDRARTLSEIRSRITELKFKYDIQLAVVDHIQLVKTSARNRFEELNEISRSLKLLSMELDLPLLVLSQLSRLVQREKRRPVLSDPRESGNLEQDSDVVMFLHVARRRAREGYARTNHSEKSTRCRTGCNPFDGTWRASAYREVITVVSKEHGMTSHLTESFDALAEVTGSVGYCRSLLAEVEARLSDLEFEEGFSDELDHLVFIEAEICAAVKELDDISKTITTVQCTLQAEGFREVH